MSLGVGIVAGAWALRPRLKPKQTLYLDAATLAQEGRTWTTRVLYENLLKSLADDEARPPDRVGLNMLRRRLIEVQVWCIIIGVGMVVVAILLRFLALR